MKRYTTAEESQRDWIAVAQRVLDGKYDKADQCEREAVAIGLRGYSDCKCQTALSRIDPDGKWVKKEGKVKARKKQSNV